MAAPGLGRPSAIAGQAAFKTGRLLWGLATRAASRACCLQVLHTGSYRLPNLVRLVTQGLLRLGRPLLVTCRLHQVTGPGLLWTLLAGRGYIKQVHLIPYPCCLLPSYAGPRGRQLGKVIQVGKPKTRFYPFLGLFTTLLYSPDLIG